MLKKSVCWNITSRCNESCQFCYRLLCNKENTYEQNQRILKMLIELKVDKITWTGGESLLYPFLFELMKEAHDNNIKNNIITNGRALTPEIIDIIEEFTDYITFSIDTLNDDVNNELGRGREHTNHIIDLMNYIVANNKKIKLKLNSVVTKKNIDNIKEVVAVAKKYPFERWKIFKFLSLRGKALENQTEFEVSDEEYEDVYGEIRKEKVNCPILKCKEEEIQNEYLLVNSVGDFIITINGKDELICNLTNMNFEKIKEIFEEWV